jgi:ketosteroid isomerase-like protein
MNRTWRVAVSVLAFTVLLAFGAAGQPSEAEDPATVQAAIAAVYDVYTQGVESLDAELWSTTWDEDGVKFMQGISALVGKDAIAKFARARFAAFKSRKMTINVDAIDVEGELALARGTYLSEDLLKNASAPTITDGWFLTVFKRQADGIWKIFRDCVGSRVAPK